MRIISWNIFGIKSSLPTLLSIMQDWRPDYICLQETKIRTTRIDFSFVDYYAFWNEATDFAHLGTALLAVRQPVCVSYDDSPKGFNSRGHLIVTETENAYIVCVYVPYSGHKRQTKDYRDSWYRYFQAFVHNLQQKKPCILCGDFNIVQHDKDAYDFHSHKSQPCFSTEEHQQIERLMQEEDLTDVYHYLHPDAHTEGFTYYPFGKNYRSKEQGYRIDLFLMSNQLRHYVRSCHPLHEIEGTCNVPLLLDIDL